jgi:hypothetical protein
MEVPEVHIITEEIAVVGEPGTDFGQNGDVAVNKGTGAIYHKADGTWTKVYP